MGRFFVAALAISASIKAIVVETLAGDRELSIAQNKTLSTLFKVDPSVFI